MIYADIIIDISSDKLDRSFQYCVPAHLEQEIKLGMVVSIPFGNSNQLRKGYVTGLSQEAKVDPSILKEIAGCCSAEETTESRLIALAAWMKENYGSTMIQALKTVLPIKEKIRAKEKRYLSLSISEEKAAEILAQLEKTRFKARTRLLRELLQEKRLDYTTASRELGVAASVVKKLEEQGILHIEYDEVQRNSLNTGDIQKEEPLPLTTEQESAVQCILEEWKSAQPRPVLLEGVTGSGKTQVYMKLIEETLNRGEQAIVLIPEIALTYQTVRRFYARFGEKVSVINSRQSQGERYDQFKRARKGEVQVMVGPRSALFTPFSRLGLIVIDEEHEPSYKSENSPRYHARETAVKRAELEHARVVLGSATPSLEAYSRAVSDEYVLVKLKARYGERPMPKVSIVDLREELKAGNRSILSRELWEGIERRLESREQIMLFLNRRGYAGFVSCRSCGHVMKCPHCDVSLSEHNNGRLICHYCGYETKKPQVCPECGSPYIGGFKAGTQQIEKVVQDTFPGVRTLRMDFDTTRNKGSYEKILASFAAHEADVLIGTQMIVKGHDFPDVTLVGVIAADLSLNADDYRCGERTFQLLCQAVGRCGRGKKPGEAVIQTYHPDHYSIQAAAVQDYEAFYEEEMSYRELMDYPPAAHMMAVLGSCPEEELLIQAMHYLQLYINRIYKKKDLHVIGPAYASVGKVKDIYRQVIYLKHEDYGTLVRIRDQMEKYIEINSGFRKIYIQFDFS
ncbi:primosomal protein N' [Blautia luti]|uniref:Replication restart protein PriA n=1 Tax=Blautia luti DSM 14534 = JCM 17040 TaxID=649762 RepID=A0A844GHC9_9FIRM|nr:primosomal protein N' [Blautia luti]MTD60101.1 primosomal protein N' [Blautia luti DSM 14534 = JCM 17040]BEI61755.1 primosomal protein N' [Blautia luti]